MKNYSTFTDFILNFIIDFKYFLPLLRLILVMYFLMLLLHFNVTTVTPTIILLFLLYFHFTHFIPDFNCLAFHFPIKFHLFIFLLPFTFVLMAILKCL